MNIKAKIKTLFRIFRKQKRQVEIELENEIDAALISAKLPATPYFKARVAYWMSVYNDKYKKIPKAKTVMPFVKAEFKELKKDLKKSLKDARNR